jgi:hypothetical protein
MPRWTSFLFGALFLGFLGAVVWKAGPAARRESAPIASSEPESVGESEDGGATGTSAVDRASVHDSGAAAAPPPSGLPVLPDDAPKTVSFGVILVAYRGAQGAPKDAPAKEDALAKATRLLAEAQMSFEETVKKGDAGSVADAGRMPRGVLEPAIEYALFTLSKGSVYESPLDTPRGFWIVRRTR